MQAPDAGSSYSFTDYAGYDPMGKRHLLTGQTQSEIFAAWISDASSPAGPPVGNAIELVSYKTLNGRIAQFKSQVGKKIQNHESLSQTGFITFDPLQSRYVLKIVATRFN